MQLDLLLNSIQKNCGDLFTNIVVLYNTSSEEYEQGYAKLAARWSVQLVRESSFASDYFSILEKANDYVCVLSDDCIFYRDIKPYLEEIRARIIAPDIFTFILGIGGDSVYSGTLKYHYRKPGFVKVNNVRIWNWTHADRGEFACPFMLAANIYNKQDYLWCLKQIQFSNPSNLEASCQHHFQVLHRNSIKFNCACLKKQALVHSLNNRVQDFFKNENGIEYPYKAGDLNKAYLEDKIINLDALDFSQVKGLHKEIKFILGAR